MKTAIAPYNDQTANYSLSERPSLSARDTNPLNNGSVDPLIR